MHPRKTVVLATGTPVPFLGYDLHPDKRALPWASVRRFRNRLRGMRDRYRAGTIDPETIGPRIRAWIAHAEHAQTWRLRRAIFRGEVFDPSRQPSYPPAPRSARRFMEQQPVERPLWDPEQEQRPKHEYRLPVGQHASMPELGGSRSAWECRGCVQG